MFDDVLDGTAGVISSHGNDVTQQFIGGAHRTLNVVQTIGATTAILKKNSPSLWKRFYIRWIIFGQHKKRVWDYPWCSEKVKFFIVCSAYFPFQVHS